MDVRELIGEVARRHNVLVSADDPVFVGVTLNELLLAEHVRRVEGAIQRAKAELDALSARRISETTRVAERLIAQGARDTGEQVRTAGIEIRAQLEETIVAGLSAARAAAEEAREHRRAAFWSAVAVFGCTGLVLGAELARWLRGG
jgi:hypothetical protein